MRPAAPLIAALALLVLASAAQAAPDNYLPHGADDIAIAPDGAIVAAAELQDGGSAWYFGAFRYDRSFGGGIVTTDFGTGPDEIGALAAQGDRIVAAGAIYSRLGLARYETR